MTLTTRDYQHMRAIYVTCDDFLDISRRARAVFWYGSTSRSEASALRASNHSISGVRLLLFFDSHLVWTQWCETRQDAIDAALEMAKRLEEGRYGVNHTLG